MNKFEQALAKYIGEANLRKIQAVTIGIAGMGGLGSNCACHLVRSGFNKFTIVDFDHIEYTNLNRQFYFYHQAGRRKVDAARENLLTINPDIDVRVIAAKLEEHNIGQVFADCDVVVEAFDRVEYKKLIVETYLNSGKLLVAASGLAGWGASDRIAVHQIKDTFYLIGDLATAVGPAMPPMSPRVNIAAAKQADVILDYVLTRM